MSDTQKPRDHKLMMNALGIDEKDLSDDVLYPGDTVKDHGWTDEQKSLMVEKHKELGDIMQYPPFSINRSKRESFQNDFQEAEIRINKTGEIDRPFSTLEVKWQDDIDEANLYKKRYSSPRAAQKAAMELNKLDPYDDEDELLPLYH